MASDDLRARVRRACAEADGFDFDGLEPYDYQRHADKILALVDAEVDAVAKRGAAVTAALGADVRATRTERDRFRLAWRSARRRADCRTTVAQLEAERHTTSRVWDEYDLMKGRAEKAEAELGQARQLNDDAWGSVWLHGKWSWLTKNMTTPERELAADAVARWSARLAAEDGEPDRGEPEGLRWWREPSAPLRAELPVTAYMGVEELASRPSTEIVRGGHRLGRANDEETER